MTPAFLDDDKPHEECGVFAVYGHDDAAAHAVLGLHALQHRGQEAAGIVAFDGRQFRSRKATGLVADSFNDPHVLAELRGHAAIGHVRYATTGASMLRNVQPLFADLVAGGIAIAHNGNLTNALNLRRALAARGALFQSTTDTEVIVHLVAHSRARAIQDRLVEALDQVEGAWSLVALIDDAVIGVRDPLGVRPLVLGRLGDAHVLASETCALDILGADFVRDLDPGEMVVIDKDGVHSRRPFRPKRRRFCVFEYVYFARPDSRLDGKGVYEIRKRIGAELAKESPADADLVVPVPDSGVPAAIGFSQASGIPFELGIIRNHYVGRTFIEPTDSIRHLGVRLKHNANRASLEGRRVVLVDDSIVRGTTSTKIVSMVRQAGAKEVHLRIASPPTIHPCFYGVDTPERAKLLAALHSLEEMGHLIGADSLAFVSIDGLYRAAGEIGRDAEHPQYCDACFTGDYPTRLLDADANEGDAQLTLLAEAD